MPNILDIIQSVQIPQLICDPLIKQGNPIMDGHNRPLHYVGGFAVVFPFEVKNEKWAFRCWVADLGNMERRLKTLSAEIEHLRLPYFCDFTYVPEGITVDGKRYPTTRMRWIEGQNLKEYLCVNRHNSQKLQNLAENFLTMCRTLHEKHIAHGDLQHGNIVIDGHDSIFLVDYDSLYTPALQGESDIITGIPDYQHPSRKSNTISSEKLDYFSELVIYISILAISRQATLIDEYHVADSDCLLFSKDDYRNLTNSGIYKTLSGLDDDIRLLLKILEEYLSKNDINELLPFDVLANRYCKAPIIKSFSCKQGGTAFAGQNVTFQWKVEDAARLYLDGIDVTSTVEKVLIASKGKKCYELVAINGLHHSMATCEINGIAEPQLSLKSSVRKTRKGKSQAICLSWEVNNANSVELVWNNHKEKIPLRGSKSINQEETTEYALWATGKDGKTIFKKQITIFATKEAEVSFGADKLFTLPGVPVSLFWEVKNAKSAELSGFGSVSMQGEKIVEPTEDTTYILEVTDAFGKQKYEVGVRMLPLPFVKTLVVPTPNIESNIEVYANLTVPDIRVNLPTYDMQEVALFLPDAFQLKVDTNDIALPERIELSVSIKPTTRWTRIKNMFNELYNKTIQWKRKSLIN